MAEAHATTGGRRTAFRVIAVVVAAGGAAYGLFTVVYGFVAESQRIHAFHNTVLATLVLVLTAPAAFAAYRDPERSIGPLVHLIVVSVAGLATMALALTIDPFTLPVVVAIGALWVLRPRRERILGPGHVSPVLLVLAIVSTLPLVAYAMAQAELQHVDTSEHADLYHWVETSFTAAAITLLGLLAALRPTRFRMSAWSAGLATAILGTASLALASYASAFDSPWAWAALAGGLVFVAAAEWERSRMRSRA